ncbi:hypothetical protein ACH4M4_25300 [Streptomyces sp. NPDC017254]|uniref:hypothetical protein n=1 Tax=unclassified Streptomyces TaxID=2593676 RepID=UPI003792A641
MTDPNDRTVCLRPNCAFAPMPTMTTSGDIVIDPYCSVLCRMWAEYALTLVRRSWSPRTEWESRQMFTLDAVLNGRAQPTEIV